MMCRCRSRCVRCLGRVFEFLDAVSVIISGGKNEWTEETLQLQVREGHAMAVMPETTWTCMNMLACQGNRKGSDEAQVCFHICYASLPGP